MLTGQTHRCKILTATNHEKLAFVWQLGQQFLIDAHNMNQEFKLSHSFPMFYVPDVTQAQEFYRDKLGFNVVEDWNFGEPPIYGGVMLDGTIFHFAEGEPQTSGVEVIVYVDGIKAYYDELQRRNVATEGDPDVKEYGQTQFGVTDCNGYRICFTETTDTNEL